MLSLKILKLFISFNHQPAIDTLQCQKEVPVGEFLHSAAAPEPTVQVRNESVLLEASAHSFKSFC